MKKTILLFIALFSSGLTAGGGLLSYDPFDLKTFIANFHTYKIGDQAEDIYFTHEYTIVDWHVRHLIKPQPGTHWSYMDGTYVLLNDRTHKILKADSHDIFYKILD